METEALRRVREMIERRRLLSTGDGVVAGFSGGSDSLCLLVMLHELAEELSLRLTAVHVNHKIRGAEAERDEAFCRAFCEKKKIPLVVVSVDVPAFAKKQGIGIEEAGRTVRYREFARVAAETGANCVAVAHHADDRAETVLLHLMRGSGLRGLTGISADSRPFEDGNLRLIRPLLSLHKAEILAELALRGEEYCIDATNREDDGDRNFLRNRVMPLLAGRNAGAARNIAKAGERLEAVREYFDAETDKVYGTVVDEAERKLHCDAMAEIPEVFRAEAALRYLELVCGHRKDLSDAHIAMLLKLCEGRVSAQVDFPHGVTLRRGYRDIEPAVDIVEAFGGRHEIARREIERGVTVTFFGERRMKLSFSVTDRENCEDFSPDPYTKCFDYDTMGKACVVRARRPGDRITISRDGKTALVQDVFVNKKVPRERRDEIPLVMTADESETLWIPGVRGSERFRVSEDTKRVLVVRLTEE